jgi:hypothetical protein
MKTRHVKALSLITVIAAAIQIGCHRDARVVNFAAKKDRVVTISPVTTGVSKPCEVDFPVTLLRKSKNHTMSWAAEDFDYWIVFVNGNPFGTSDIIKVPKDGQTIPPFPIAIDPDPIVGNYFKYAIYDFQPGSNPDPKKACKGADDERDTGLNVKR